MKWLIIIAVSALCSLAVGAGAAVSDTRPPGYAGFGQQVDFPAAAEALEAMRSRGDLDAERQHVWQLFAELGRTNSPERVPAFMTWYGAGEVFGSRTEQSDAMAPRSLARTMSVPRLSRLRSELNPAPPLIVRAHYNLAAYRHIRENRLDVAAQLASLPSIPSFPRDSVVVKTAWWPVPATGTVALPVWDAAGNAPRTHGNDYPSWSRVVAVSRDRSAVPACDVELMGRHYAGVRRFGVGAFFHLTLDAALASQIMQDPISRKATGVLLGRPLQAGDVLLLVALHVATRETEDWVWGTFWWHDAASVGQYAIDRPSRLSGPWRQYLMNVAFDSELPRESDGSPHIAFNPWFEGRFADHGNGGGVVSNCMSCHRRASTALAGPFEVSRGSTEVTLAPYPDATSTRTSSLWSLPLQSQ